MRFIPFGALAAAALFATAACGQSSVTDQVKEEAQAPANANPAAFLSENALAPGVKTTPSGLQYQVVKSGPAAGKSPTIADTVTVNYAAILLDGTVIDSSYQRHEPATFPIHGLVHAWEEALPMMKPGDEWILWAPPALAYGPEGNEKVPPNAVLKFRIELIKVD
jgi:FKBP-type peptidyl-prolyl cis-trans isomerase